MLGKLYVINRQGMVIILLLTIACMVHGMISSSRGKLHSRFQLLALFEMYREVGHLFAITTE